MPVATLPVTCQPFSDERTAALLADFHRDGYVVIPGVLTPEEVGAMVERIHGFFADDRLAETHNRYGDIVMTRLFELDPFFRDMLVREPIISLVEAVLGPKCHLIAQNCVRNPRGQAIDSWHVDEDLVFPLPENVARHDPSIPMPVHLLTVQMLLTDVPDDAHGPTQFVPGSHYSGRNPPPGAAPTFDGQGPVSIHGKAGDIYLHNGQAWHRGAPNQSDQVRILYQQTYGRRWISQRFYPFVNYQFPQGLLDGAGERLRRVLGLHGKGPYG